MGEATGSDGTPEPAGPLIRRPRRHAPTPLTPLIDGCLTHLAARLARQGRSSGGALHLDPLALSAAAEGGSSRLKPEVQAMKQRAVVIVADYLSKRTRGRLTRVLPVGEDDYVLSIEDVRDGRTQLIRSPADLEVWLESFRLGICLQPVGAICGMCDRIHTDRGFDDELFSNCVGCQVGLVDVLAELDRRRSFG